MIIKSVLVLALGLLMQLQTSSGTLETITIANIQQLEIIEEFEVEPMGSREITVAFSDDSQILAYITAMAPWADGGVAFIDTRTLEPFRFASGEALAGTALHFTSEWLLVGTEDGFLQRYALDSSKLVDEIRVSPNSEDTDDPLYTNGGDVEVIATSSDESFYAVAATSERWGENILYLSAFDEEPILQISAGEPPNRALGRGYDVAFHPTDAFVVFAGLSDDGTGHWVTSVQIRDIETGTLESSCDSFRHSLNTHTLVVSPDGTHVIYNADNGIRIWDTRNCADHDDAWTILKPVNEEEWVTTMEVHPTEPILAVALSTRNQDCDCYGVGVLQFWDIQSRELLYETTDYGAVGSYNVITNLTFSPDGTMLATGSEDDTVRLWGIPADE